ncbi:hypothetical protein BU25DRAFT_5072 [Macroventuria anomochaeta]|uniref:Uncharacterized protein n=1 Tax=Macroventuria anomochaeta TaxID=301207 RepID=A0ACB6SIG9_9PLEO|nr:uncharacterized protein BU25DRAFT_5072 [Macroventuria anomochaeta]KAF2633400.1 hypothetical protein BU25DRAFT_5072 [Macroventuria anomochaeta]
MPVSTTASVSAARRTNTSAFLACRTAVLTSCTSTKSDGSETAQRASSHRLEKDVSRSIPPCAHPFYFAGGPAHLCLLTMVCKVLVGRLIFWVGRAACRSETIRYSPRWPWTQQRRTNRNGMLGDSDERPTHDAPERASRVKMYGSSLTGSALAMVWEGLECLAV